MQASPSALVLPARGPVVSGAPQHTNHYADVIVPGPETRDPSSPLPESARLHAQRPARRDRRRVRIVAERLTGWLSRPCIGTSGQAGVNADIACAGGRNVRVPCGPDRFAPLSGPGPPAVLAADGRATPRGHAVNVQPHGRPSIAARGLGQGERPAPLRGAGTRLPQGWRGPRPPACGATAVRRRPQSASPTAATTLAATSTRSA